MPKENAHIVKMSLKGGGRGAIQNHFNTAHPKIVFFKMQIIIIRYKIL